MPPPPFLLILPKKKQTRKHTWDPAGWSTTVEMGRPSKRRTRMKWDDKKENKGRIGRPDGNERKIETKKVRNEKQFWHGENISNRRNTHFYEAGKVWEFPSLVSSRSTMMSIWELMAELAQSLSYAYMCLKRADCCECKYRTIWSRDRDNTHSHIHILVVMKTSQTRWNGRQTWG